MYLKTFGDKTKMQACISLGSRCYTEMIQKKYGLKKFSSFFGSTNIKSIDNLLDVLQDNFQDIMNIKKLTSTNEVQELPIRTLYSKFDTDFHNSTFAHHNLHEKSDYEHFLRCAERMNIIKDKKIKTLFIYSIHDSVDTNDITESNCDKLADFFKKEGYNFHILFVHHSDKNPNRVLKVMEKHNYSIFEMGGTGTDNDDDNCFKEILDTFTFKLLSIDQIYEYPSLENQVTLVITSCGRPDLLERTLSSFINYNTYPISSCIIVEDSGKQGINDFVYKMNIPFLVELIYNETNIGQVHSIDKAYSKVITPWIFHCEEDWEFYRQDFIQDSMKILQQDNKLTCVWLRRYGDSPHPIEPQIINGSYRLMSPKYHEINSDRIWNGFTFNPSLRKKSDYDIVKPYSECCKPYYNGVTPEEYDLQRVYRELGYRSAITLNENGYVRHIGWHRHVERYWE